jgi:hypothetical protein
MNREMFYLENDFPDLKTFGQARGFFSMTITLIFSSVPERLKNHLSIESSCFGIDVREKQFF